MRWLIMSHLICIYTVWIQSFNFTYKLPCNRWFMTRGPWWSYIAHLSKQICILTVEDSAKFTALRFMYKFYSPAHLPPPTPPPHPPLPPTHQVMFFLFNTSWLDLILKEGHQRNISGKLFSNWSSGFWQKDFKVFYIAIKPYALTAIFFFFFFWRIMTAWTNLVEGHQRNIPAKLNWNQFSGFWQEDFWSFLFRSIGKISPTP